MARTLELAAPTGLTLTCELVARGTNVVTETVTLTEKTVAKQIYTGTLTAAAGTYEINLKSGSSYIGKDEVIVNGTDGTTSRASSVTPDLTGTTVKDATDVQTSITALASTLATILAAVDTEIAAIKAKTDNLPASPAAVGDIPTFSQIWTTALTEAYRNTGATGSAAQLLYEILQNLTEFSISGTRKTVKKLDASTNAKTYTLNSATSPTSITQEM